MKNFLITESEKKEILKKHGLLKEQTATDKVTDKVLEDFIKVVESPCLGNSKRTEIKKSKDGKRYYIAKKTQQGNDIYFYSDMSVVKVVNGVAQPTKKLYCPEATQNLQGAGAQVTGGQGTGAQVTGGQGAGVTPTVKFSQTNLDALNELKKQGFYYMENPPSQFKVDQGEYVKLDITGKDTKNPAEYVNLVTAFSKYFPEFKESLYVYKSTPQEKTAGRGEKVEVTKESCQTAVFELERLMDEPNSFSLTNDQIVAHIQTAKRCQDKGNKLGLLNLKYNKAFKKVQDRYFKYN